ARRFAAAGAQHVVFVAKHSDGYCLWPTDVRHPHRSRWHSTRDVVGEMAEAVRGAGMRFGLYYCGGFDWSFDDRPVGTMGDVVASVPRGDYPAYAAAQMRELISRYRPSVLWNDVAWPSSGKELWPLFHEYYAQVPDGVVNDRWLPSNRVVSAMARGRLKGVIDAGARKMARRDGGLIPPAPPHFDVRTPEYVAFPDTQTRAWELVRGIDRSFGYNASGDPTHLLSRDDMLWSLVDAVAKGGNLLLNVGPRGSDAQIPAEQIQRLDWLAQWMGANRSAVVATRPWVVPGSVTFEGQPVRYNAASDAVHAVVQSPGHTVTLPELAATSTTSACTVDGVPLEHAQRSCGLEVRLPADVVDAAAAGPVALVLRSVSARPAG
ncbi:MAG: alpha-L-fucosidase, partial [Actinomycetota bacterium]